MIGTFGYDIGDRVELICGCRMRLVCTGGLATMHTYWRRYRKCGRLKIGITSKKHPGFILVKQQAPDGGFVKVKQYICTFTNNK